MKKQTLISAITTVFLLTQSLTTALNLPNIVVKEVAENASGERFG
jgi:hypothetical protein